MVDDVDLVATPGDALLQLRAIALQLYATDIAIALVVLASPGLFGSIRGAHEPLVRFFEPITLGPLDAALAAEAIAKPLAGTGMTFDDAVVAEIVELSGGRPYYLQKLAYFAFDAAEGGRVGRAEFAEAFASVSQEMFASRWSAMAPAERQVVSVVASATAARPSGEIEEAAKRLGIAPPATRQALHRLAARGHTLADQRLHADELPLHVLSIARITVASAPVAIANGLGSSPSSRLPVEVDRRPGSPHDGRPRERHGQGPTCGGTAWPSRETRSDRAKFVSLTDRPGASDRPRLQVGEIRQRSAS